MVGSVRRGERGAIGGVEPASLRLALALTLTFALARGGVLMGMGHAVGGDGTIGFVDLQLAPQLLAEAGQFEGGLFAHSPDLAAGHMAIDMRRAAALVPYFAGRGYRESLLDSLMGFRFDGGHDGRRPFLNLTRSAESDDVGRLDRRGDPRGSIEFDSNQFDGIQDEESRDESKRRGGWAD